MVKQPSEFESIRTVHDALEPLDAAGRTRVLNYIQSYFGITVESVRQDATKRPAHDNDEIGAEEGGGDVREIGSYDSLAELFDATRPTTNAEKALVVAYWLQVCGEAENFTAAAANKELMHLGHKIPNITDAIDTIREAKPALILQLKKAGTSRQARKTYKVSHEGIRSVEAMITRG